MTRQGLTLSLVVLATGLAGCGESGTVIAASVAPTPIAAATPPPPSPPPPQPPAAGAIARITPGGVLTGTLACARGDLQFTATADGGRRLGDVKRLGPIKIDNVVYISYLATNNFYIDVNGFGGSSFLPSELKSESAGSTWPMLYFRKLPDRQYVEELEIHDGNGPGKGLVDSTLGRYSDGQSLCFFAVGSDRGPIAGQGRNTLGIVADGIIVDGTGARRIAVSTASADVNWSARTIDIYFDMHATVAPFGQITNSTALGRATARLSVSPIGVISGALDGPGGSSGRIMGSFFEFGNGAGLVFELTYPNGDRAFGALALDKA